METLGKLFGSNAIVKILRLFLFNPAVILETKDVSSRTKVQIGTVRIELSMMERVGLIKKKSFFKEVVRKRGKRKATVKKRVSGWMLDSTFEYLEPLQHFFLTTATLRHDDLVKKLRKAGKLKAVIIAGVFIQNWDSRVDILVVADVLKKSKLEAIIKDIEAEIGMELKYAAFSTKDFKYRVGIRDRLIRDILDYPHQKIVNRLDIV